MRIMEGYNQAQWLLIFFIYSVFGWIWETGYVSAKKRKFINRGFLHGPWLPIYGSGAVIVLICTLPVRENLILVYFLGMLGATILEYVTGAVMERLFHVRYWDYSKQPLNLNGHICLGVSLAWGCFSVLLVRFLHPPVEELVLAIPLWMADAAALILAVLFVVDATRSVQVALDMKELLESLTANSQRLAEWEQDLHQLAQRISQRSEALQQKMDQLEEIFTQSREQRKESRREYLRLELEEHRYRKFRLLALLEDKSEAALMEIRTQLEQSIPEPERIRLQGVKEKLQTIQVSVKKTRDELSAWRERDYQRAMDLLYRNPTAISRKHKDAIRELREWKTEEKKGKDE